MLYDDMKRMFQHNNMNFPNKKGRPGRASLFIKIDRY
jgi:hypothetical protein